MRYYLGIVAQPRATLIRNLSNFVARDGWDLHADISRNYGSVVNMKGWLGQPALYISDPKALHSIIVTLIATREKC
ncbi:hypothetical protein BKA93DRAFT_150434 [Sparassis latifolia]